MKNHKNTASKRQDKDNEKNFNRALHDLLFTKPLSRRTAITLLGYPDQSFMITQPINDLIKSGKAMVVGKVKCSRSGNFVEGVTTNPALFPLSNQLKMF